MSDPAHRRLTAGLMLGVGVHAMEGFSIHTALPALTADLDARPLYGAVITMYLLGSLGGLVWAGVRTDEHGPRGTLRWGLLAIGAGLLGASLAPEIYVLLAARVLQGFGGGALTTVLYAVVHRAYPRERWASVLALLSLAWGGSAVALPGALGMIVDHAHWRFVFALGIPLAALAGVLTLPVLRRFDSPAAEHSLAPEAAQDAALDVAESSSDGPVEGAGDNRVRTRRSRGRLGLAVSAVVLGALVLLHPPGLPGLAPTVSRVVLAVVGGLAMLSGLVVLWPPGVLTLRPGLPAAVGTKALACAVFFGAEAHLPLALTEVHQRGSTFVGFVLTAAAMAWSASAFLQARLLPRFGAARTTLAGALAIAAAVAGLLLLANPSLSPWLALPIWALGAGGMGFVYNTTSDSALAATSEADSGATGTALGISDAIGAAVGTGIASAILNGAGQLTSGLSYGWLALLALAVPMVLGARRLGDGSASLVTATENGVPTSSTSASPTSST